MRSKAKAPKCVISDNDITEQKIGHFVRSSMYRYGCHVIEDRAIPEYRDGLKPAQRRILYSMYELGALPDKCFKKSARVTGDCFVAGTLVSTPTGLVPIEDLVLGSLVCTSTGVQPVTGLFEQPEKTLLQVKLSSGSLVTCTSNQKFRVICSRTLDFAWVSAANLKPDDLVCVRPNLNAALYKCDLDVPGYVLDCNLHVVPVLSVEVAEPQVTYDIGVGSVHEFYANGMLVHNCSGKYHPHSSTYSTLVRLAFQRYPLVVPQGSFGNEFDPPAAERYTEVRLAPITDSVFSCLSVAPMVPNYSDELKEPLIFSSRLPLILLNGSDGIAVGLKNTLPSHNLKEVIDALIYVARSGESATLRTVLKHIQGPDCISGGILLSSPDDVYSLYERGSGRLEYACDYTVGPDDFDPKITSIKIVGWPDSWRVTKFAEKTIPALTEARMIRSFDLIYDENNGTIKEIHVGVDNKPALDAVIKSLHSRSSYNLNITVRNSVDDIAFRPTNLLTLLKSWISWREGEEAKLLGLQGDKIEHDLMIENARLLAMLNISVLVKILATDGDVSSSIDELCSVLKCTKEAARFILDLRLRDLRRADLTVQRGRIVKLEASLASVTADKANLAAVVIRELQALRKYQDARRTQIRPDAAPVAALVSQGDTLAFGVTRDGRVFSDIQPIRTTTTSDMYVVGSYSGITLVDASGLALNVSSDASGVQSKTFRNIVGIASHAFSYIVAVTEDGFVVKVALSARGSDYPLAKTGLRYAFSAQDSSTLVAWDTAGQAHRVLVKDIPENRRNGRGTRLFKFIPSSVYMYHDGDKLMSRSGAFVSKASLSSFSSADLLSVGSRNLVAYESGRRAFLKGSSVLEALAAGGISQVWSLDAPKL